MPILIDCDTSFFSGSELIKIIIYFFAKTKQLSVSFKHFMSVYQNVSNGHKMAC